MRLGRPERLFLANVWEVIGQTPGRNIGLAHSRDNGLKSSLGKKADDREKLHFLPLVTYLKEQRRNLFAFLFAPLRYALLF